MANEKKDKQNNLLRSTKEIIFSLAPALILVFVIRSSVIEAFKIPSGSMKPTLLVGDQIFVNKFSYGLRVPFTDWIGEKSIYFFRRELPKRGDIIVFKYPVDPDIYYIKRIVAVPGDVIQMKGKELFINNTPFDRSTIPEEKLAKIRKDLADSEEESPPDRMNIFYEKFDETTGTIMTDPTAAYSTSFDPVTIPEDQFFVMGDNRDNSRDSRFWGMVPFDNIKGRAFIIWLSVWLDFDNFEQSKFSPTRTGTLLR